MFMRENGLYVSAVPDNGYTREGHDYHDYPEYPDIH